MHLLDVVSGFNTYLTGPAVPVLLMGAGLYFSVRMRFFCITHPRMVIRVLFRRGEEGMGSPVRAAMLALAGTLGVGNIVGVASAITLGGRGAVFWMWAAAFAAMLLKYAEIVLAMLTRRRDPQGIWHGGAFFYANRIPARIFAVFCLAASLTMGNMIQVKAAADAAHSCFSLPPVFVGGTICVMAFFVIRGGGERISGLTARLIPLLSGIYILFSLAVILTGWDRIGAVTAGIFQDAFSLRPVAGGGIGYMLSGMIRPMRYGVARGIMSNEAGCGTAPTAHASAKNDSPAAQGLWGIFEVFADTILLCTLTAYVILLYLDATGIMPSSCSDMELALDAFAFRLGRPSAVIMTLSVFCYAFASLICWAYYGLESLAFLTESRGKTLYATLFSLTALVGSVIPSGWAWELSDLALGVMTAINIGALLRHRKVILSETQSFLRRELSSSGKQPKPGKKHSGRSLRAGKKQEKQHHVIDN